nr:reverse transcriptase domain-containing protein [Tanacetum cinerariifolium]
DDKLPVIIAKDLSVEEKTALITILKSHKRAIAWKLSDIKGIDPEFFTHKILMEEDFELAVQHQRRVNPKIHDVIKQEVIKLLDDGLIYPISDSPWVSPVHCVPKKGGFTVVENEDNDDFLLKEVDLFLAIEDDPTSTEFYQPYLNPEGDILLLEAFINDGPSLPPPNQGNYLPEVCKELKIYEAKYDQSSIDEPPEVKLKDLPPHLEYAFLEDDDKLQVIIVKYLSVEEKTALITVLKSHKRAIAWKLSDIK